MENKNPSEKIVKQIIEDLNLGTIIFIKRFDTGKAHFVYDVKTTQDEFVVRLTKPEQKLSFESAVYWYQLLKPMNIPLPNFRFFDLEGQKYGFPIIIMDRLPGRDLLHEYQELAQHQKETLANEIIAIQQKVGTLKEGPGYGYASSYEDSKLYNSWQGVLDQYMDRITSRNKKTKIIDEKYIQRLSNIYKSMHQYVENVKPIPFLDDTTTKNVIIDQGKLSGIVDVDNVCFGDPLLVLALTRMALLGLGEDTYYTDYWSSQLDLTHEQNNALNMYTGMFALEFASSMGHTFNKETPEEIDTNGLNQLTSIFENITNDL